MGDPMTEYDDSHKRQITVEVAITIRDSWYNPIARGGHEISRVIDEFEPLRDLQGAVEQAASQASHAALGSAMQAQFTRRYSRSTEPLTQATEEVMDT